MEARSKVSPYPQQNFLYFSEWVDAKSTITGKVYGCWLLGKTSLYFFPSEIGYSSNKESEK